MSTRPLAKPSDLPPRTSGTMSDAIAMSSPCGRMSKRAHRAATEQLRASLFGEEGYQPTPPRQPTEIEALLAHAARLRDLASRGMSVKKFIREAEKAERQVAELSATAQPSSPVDEL